MFRRVNLLLILSHFGKWYGLPQRQLDLQTESVREGLVADGRTATVPYVGPVKVAFGKRFCCVGALWF